MSARSFRWAVLALAVLSVAGLAERAQAHDGDCHWGDDRWAWNSLPSTATGNFTVKFEFPADCRVGGTVIDYHFVPAVDVSDSLSKDDLYAVKGTVTGDPTTRRNGCVGVSCGPSPQPSPDGLVDGLRTHLPGLLRQVTLAATAIADQFGGRSPALVLNQQREMLYLLKRLPSRQALSISTSPGSGAFQSGRATQILEKL